MKPDPNYPRMLFHPRKDPVTVYSEEQEVSLGPEWSRTIVAALPREEKPARVPGPEPEPDDDDAEQPDEEPEPQDVEHKAEPAKPKRGRPAAHKPPHKTAHKRS